MTDPDEYKHRVNAVASAELAQDILKLIFDRVDAHGADPDLDVVIAAALSSTFKGVAHVHPKAARIARTMINMVDRK